MNEVRLTVVVDGEPPTCYGCDQKGHIGRMYALNIQPGWLKRSCKHPWGHETRRGWAGKQNCYLSKGVESEYTEIMKRESNKIGTPPKEKKKINEMMHDKQPTHENTVQLPTTSDCQCSYFKELQTLVN